MRKSTNDKNSNIIRIFVICRLSPKIDREERELRIINEAQKIIREDGFVNFKMSDLGKKSDMSVGTLYSHFPSKEDLLLGLHLSNLSLKERLFERVLQNDAWSPLEKLVGMTLADWDINRKLEELSEVDSLAKFPSIWKKASPGITGRLEERAKVIGDLVKSCIDGVLNSEEVQLVPSLKENPLALGVTFWSLGFGLNDVFQSFCVKKVEGITQDMEESIALEAMLILVKGIGSKQTMSLETISELLKEIQKFTEEGVS